MTAEEAIKILKDFYSMEIAEPEAIAALECAIAELAEIKAAHGL